MRTQWTLSILAAALFSSLALGGAPANPIHAAKPTPTADVTIEKNQQKRSINCGGGSVSITGDQNDVTLTGECDTLSIDGNANLVNVEAVAHITTRGNRNKVYWGKGVGGKAPKISNPGTANIIEKSGK